MSALPALGRKDSWIEVVSHGEMGTASKQLSTGMVKGHGNRSEEEQAPRSSIRDFVMVICTEDETQRPHMREAEMTQKLGNGASHTRGIPGDGTGPLQRKVDNMWLTWRVVATNHLRKPKDLD
ncbi:hypothetical protein EDD15DRAFT_2196378 [Pisolithus albus]|nr:hypothetical protein EDD15DRAFT_2196378 [Pisolithus albus]